MTGRILILAATAAGLLATAAHAQDKSGQNVDKAATGERGAVSELKLAQDLYAWGTANKDALAVITAAKIVATTPTEDKERTAEEKPIEGADQTEDGEGADMPADAAAMLASAKELAAGDETLAEVIADVEAAQPRGRVLGPSKTLRRLRAGRIDIFTEVFEGGRLAEVAIIGDGDTDLDLIISDENGNDICVDTSYSDKLYCSWTPSWTGAFVIGIKNQGRIRNSYWILTN